MRASSSARVFARRWIAIASPTISRTVMRGFRLEYGSWKMICIRRRSGRSSRCERCVMSSPSKSTRPNVGSTRRSIRRPSVLLPQPLSPTRPMRLAAAHAERDAVDRADEALVAAPRPPVRTGKYFDTRSVATSVRAASALGTAAPDSLAAAARRGGWNSQSPPLTARPRRRASSATSRPGATRARSGSSLRALARCASGSDRRSGTRAGALRRSGTSPSMACSRRRAPVACDAARRGCSRAARACTGASGGRRARAPARARRRALRTSPRRARACSATTPRSCVMSRMLIAKPLPADRRSSARICAWMVTSSAVVGSSASRSFGSHASAIAIITRWRWPPESWCGYASTARLGLRDADEAQELDRARARLAPRLLLVKAIAPRRSASRPCRRGSGWSSAPGRSSTRRCRERRASRARAIR